MSSSMIKAIAITAMIIDHVGAVLFPHMIILRIIGRIALPLFAWQLSISLDKTHNPRKLLTRILLFALISQVPYAILFGSRLNIFFSFTLSVMTLILYKKNKFAGYLALFLSIIMSQALNIEYGWYAIMMVFLFYSFKEDLTKSVLAQIALNTAYCLMYPGIQPYALLSLLIIGLYNNEKGRLYDYRLATYSIYPAHMLLLIVLNRSAPLVSHICRFWHSV